MDSPSFAEDAAHYLLVTRVMFACGYALVLYDWLISLLRERRLIWPLQFSLLKVLYLLSRYWPIAVVPLSLVTYYEQNTLEHCLKLFRIPVALTTCNQLWAEGILLARTSAFWGNKRIVTVSLSLTLLCVATYQLWVVFYPMILLPFLTPPYDKGPCLPTDNGSHILGYFVAALVFDSLATCLMICRLLQIRREEAIGNSPLVRLFVAEGLWYFVLVSLGNLLNGVFYFQPIKAMSAVNVPFSIMLPNIVACRLILDLREQGTAERRWQDSKAPSGLAGFMLPGAWIRTVPPPGPVSTIVFGHAAPNNESGSSGDSELTPQEKKDTHSEGLMSTGLIEMNVVRMFDERTIRSIEPPEKLV